MGRVRFSVGAPSGVLPPLVGKCFGLRERARRPFHRVIRRARVIFPAFYCPFAKRLGFGFGRDCKVAPGAWQLREKSRRFARRRSRGEANVERRNRAFAMAGGDGCGQPLGVVLSFGGRVGGRDEGDEVADFRL